MRNGGVRWSHGGGALVLVAMLSSLQCVSCSLLQKCDILILLTEREEVGIACGTRDRARIARELWVSA